MRANYKQILGAGVVFVAVLGICWTMIGRVFDAKANSLRQEASGLSLYALPENGGVAMNGTVVADFNPWKDGQLQIKVDDNCTVTADVDDAGGSTFAFLKQRICIIGGTQHVVGVIEMPNAPIRAGDKLAFNMKLFPPERNKGP